MYARTTYVRIVGGYGQLVHAYICISPIVGGRETRVAILGGHTRFVPAKIELERNGCTLI